MEEPRAQGGARVRMDWGQRGARAICPDDGVAVVVDVLSFTTTLSVAIEAGAEVYPFPFKDASAPEFARRHGARLAMGRFEARLDPGVAVSLSPASMRGVTGLGRIVLPSPNGSALARLLAGRGATVVGAALRNRTAVARWIAGHRYGDSAVAVVAAGERWPDDSLRPAVEDLWGAGAVITALSELGVAGLSPEAQAAAAAFADVASDVRTRLAECASGRELTLAGFADDVAIAAELDSADCVPVLSGERFVNAG